MKYVLGRACLLEKQCVRDIQSIQSVSNPYKPYPIIQLIMPHIFCDYVCHFSHILCSTIGSMYSFFASKSGLKGSVFFYLTSFFTSTFFRLSFLPLVYASWATIYHAGPVFFMCCARVLWSCTWCLYVPRKHVQLICVLPNTCISHSRTDFLALAYLSIIDHIKKAARI